MGDCYFIGNAGCVYDAGATAAWAQALLSFAGIVVGAYIAARVAGLPTLANRHQRLAALAGMIDVARKVLKAASKESSVFDGPGVTGVAAFDLSRFDRTIAALAAVPLFEVSPGVLVEGLIELQENLASARDEMELLISPKPDRPKNNMHHFYGAAIRQAEGLLSDVTSAAMVASRAERRWLLWW